MTTALTNPSGLSLLAEFSGTFTEIGWIPPDQVLPYGEWEACFSKVKKVRKAMPWIVGDLMAYGESRYGEDCAQALEAKDYEHGTLSNYKWVCSHWPIEKRRKELSFSHHQEATPDWLSGEERHALMEMAIDKELNSTQFREFIAQYRAERDAPETPLLIEAEEHLWEAAQNPTGNEFVSVNPPPKGHCPDYTDETKYKWVPIGETSQGEPIHAIVPLDIKSEGLLPPIPNWRVFANRLKRWYRYYRNWRARAEHLEARVQELQAEVRELEEKLEGRDVFELKPYVPQGILDIEYGK